MNVRIRTVSVIVIEIVTMNKQELVRIILKKQKRIEELEKKLDRGL